MKLLKFSLFLAVLGIFNPLFASTEGENKTAEKFKPSEMIMHHISDAHEWHLFETENIHAVLPLPVILYSKEHGLDIFLSNKLAPVTHHEGTEHTSEVHEATEHDSAEHGEAAVAHTEAAADAHVDHHATHEYGVYNYGHGHFTAKDGAHVYDFSLTKNVASMLISVVLLCIIFISVARTYASNPKKAPKGLQGFMEVIIIFVRDEVAKATLGKKYKKFLPYLLTLFFFIWFNNLLGLLPGAANVTGNIAVTCVLALLTLIITNVNGNKHYWGHIFNTPGVPWWLKFPIPIMPVVEMISIFTKPFALMIRLFANIAAGHIIILSMIALVFIFGQNSVGGGFGISPVSLFFGIFMFTMELVVALIQAYIFTMLTSLFIGQAIEEHHHEGDHSAEGHH